MVETALPYIHDVRDDRCGLVGANRTNADIYSEIERYLETTENAVLTADDGYRSVLRLIPHLEYNNAKLIVFLTSGFLSRRVFPYEVSLSNMLEQKSDFTVFGEVFESEEAFKVVHGRLKPLAPRARRDAMRKLATENALDLRDFEDDRFLTWREAALLARHPNVEIGAHTSNHVYLPAMTKASAFAELLLPRLELMARLKVPVRALAYPYGGCNRSISRLAQKAGYHRAYTTKPMSRGAFEYPRQSLPMANSRLENG